MRQAITSRDQYVCGVGITGAANYRRYRQDIALLQQALTWVLQQGHGSWVKRVHQLLVQTAAQQQ
jgi:hypothetical protein